MTISAGVFLGRAEAITKLASKPGRKSPTVGRSGSVSDAPLSSRHARSLPTLTYQSMGRVAK